MVLRAVRYSRSIWSYALSGTDVAFGPTCCPEGGKLQSADRAVGRGGKKGAKEEKGERVEEQGEGVMAGRWVVITVSVDSKAGRMHTYVDGTLASKVPYPPIYLPTNSGGWWYRGWM
eukprot:3311607-Rhodomonas_salina.1